MMLSKKIRHLKSKFEEYCEKISLIDDIIEENSQLRKEILILKKDIETIAIASEEQKSLSKEIITYISTFEAYRKNYSNDIGLITNAITELYSVINYVLNGKVVLVGYDNLKNNMTSLKEEEHVKEELYDDLFEEVSEDDKSLDEKKKKVFH
jgi:hypothetical protein